MAERKWKPLGSMDWLDNKRAKALRVSNDREALQPLSYSESIQDETTDTQPFSEKESIDMPWSQYGDHLPNFVSFLRLPTKRLNNDRKHSKDLTPFSGMDLPMQALSGRNHIVPRNSGYNVPPPSKVTQKASIPRYPSLDNSISLQETVALFPSLQRLSTKGDRPSLSTVHLHNQVSGNPALQRKLKTMIEKEQEDDSLKLIEPLPQIKPEEILSCRYLRLSQSNIDTLLELCKESGIYIDLHPHMKESDIDVSTVLSSNPSRAL
ncbi:uncharacterized protein C16orf78 homolog isoform X2 [Sceloporus undulatus]|uniref:uncharacterized protein C16orf78 homolog isoform X2 n=1 Tax=Sceloporus undulatus TaxID=8520 RepID=UPI001C4C5335|nr:uncharacterized protein C16orf78 homolog isoform X2 [Sceloporus undulatus]